MSKRGVNLSVLAKTGDAMAALSKATKKAVDEKIAEANSRPGEALQIRVSDIEIREQVRDDASEGLEGLIERIREAGRVYTPVNVIPAEGGKWILVAGERRVRASLYLNLETIPAIVLYGVAEEAIRTHQVQENAERKPFTVAQTVRGVIADYKLGGLGRAQRVWGHSQPWVAKRVAFDGYRQEIKDLLFNKQTEDFELLGALEGLSKTPGAEKQYKRFLGRLQSNGVVSRDDIRLAQQAFKARAAEESANNNATDEAGANEADLAGLGNALERDQADAEGGGENGSDQLPETHGKASPVQSGDGVVSGEVEKLDGLDGARVALYGRANGLKSAIEKLRKEIKANKLSVEDEEWVLWCAFVDVVAPALALLGPGRSPQALRTLAADLKRGKNRSIGDLLVELHGSGDAAIANPPRPESWLVMTDPVGTSE